MFVSFYSTSSVRNIFRFDKYLASYSRNMRRKVRRSLPEVFFIFVQFWPKFEGANTLQRSSQISYSMKIRPAVVKLLHATRRTSQSWVAYCLQIPVAITPPRCAFLPLPYYHALPYFKLVLNTTDEPKIFPITRTILSNVKIKEHEHVRRLWATEYRLSRSE
jgi:hypothetical protein